MSIFMGRCRLHCPVLQGANIISFDQNKKTARGPDCPWKRYDRLYSCFMKLHTEIGISVYLRPLRSYGAAYFDCRSAHRVIVGDVY